MSGLDESPVTFKASKSFHEWLGKKAFSIDVSKSKLIRAAILAGVPILESNKHLIEILDNGPISGLSDQ